MAQKSGLLLTVALAVVLSHAEINPLSAERVLSDRRPERQAWWTEAVAVGREEFVENAARTCSYRRSMEKREFDARSEIGLDHT